ncbi:glycogenin-1 isoform X1 [Octopus bimaculoides]|uniref:glycogenin glucosyltransferase n=1 Tax=Octopus bimaculoides TaxID=37653 RepID=A0A0L8H6V7_OCTBM|nr:glycogenin-1 isoform X1 [Octopus bimaculoides]
MAEGGKEAFVTLATNDTYVLGCLVLGESLRRTKTQRKLVVLITKGVSESLRKNLYDVFDEVCEVDIISSHDYKNLQLLGRPDLNVTFTKLYCWKLTQYSKCVFLDADTLVLDSVDELFEKEELSAAPDPGWPDCFNSGVFVMQPNEETYKSLIQFAKTEGSFDGGDQGLLNLFFKDWATKDIKKHLPFVYNVVSQAFYSYLPAFKQFKQNVKIVHFLGAIKPWQHCYNAKTKTVTPLPNSGHDPDFLQRWWNIFMESVHPVIDHGKSQELKDFNLSTAPPSFLPSSPSPPPLSRIALTGPIIGADLSCQGQRAAMDEFEKRMAWEHGEIDYMGQDSFDNIQRKLDLNLNQNQSGSM